MSSILLSSEAMTTYGLEGCVFSSNFIFNFLACKEGKLFVQDARQQSIMNTFQLPEDIVNKMADSEGKSLFGMYQS